MKLLIGSSGLIGTVLKDCIKFDFEFNSKNIKNLSTLNFNEPCDLYLACLPATKWKVNLNPQKDLDNIYSILEIISKKKFRSVVLYSTVDVYNDAPLESDESYPLSVTKPGYGSNRLVFEKLIESNISYDKLTILRLPALFGKHLKKNIIYDLLNNNEVDKINYNSSYQWYNLNDLVKDTIHCVKTYNDKVNTINLFTEPIHTSEILNIFNVDKCKVNTKLTEIKYNYKTNTNSFGYVRDRKRILEEIKNFIDLYKLHSTKVAVCLFGEPRDIVSRIPHWQKFNKHFNTHFYLAFYSDKYINNTIDLIKKELPVKSYFVTDNDLEFFDKLKYNAKLPIYLHTADPKATFCRITSQCFIRQKVASLVNMEEYDVILMCRSDISNFNTAFLDFKKIKDNDDLLIVNYGAHIHAGGGGGCTKCTEHSKCDLTFHANDICDWWCMGSPKVMSNWKTFYDNVLQNYYEIQKTVPKVDTSFQLQCIPKVETNEMLVILPTGNWYKIENDVHCYYPEKLMRVAFKDCKIINATIDKTIWK